MNKYNDMYCCECIHWHNWSEDHGTCGITLEEKMYCDECNRPNKFEKEVKNEKEFYEIIENNKRRIK